MIRRISRALRQQLKARRGMMWYCRAVAEEFIVGVQASRTRRKRNQTAKNENGWADTTFEKWDGDKAQEIYEGLEKAEREDITSRTKQYTEIEAVRITEDNIQQEVRRGVPEEVAILRL